MATRPGGTTQPAQSRDRGALLVALGWILFVAAAVFVILALSIRGFVPSILLFAVAGATASAGVATYNQGRRHLARPAERVLASDARPPVLYLRSFREDVTAARVVDTSLTVRTEEEQLVCVLRRIGPVVAIGAPGEVLPPLGAARTYAAEDEWQGRVLDWMRQAALVVLRPSTTEAFWWEVSRIAETVAPQRVIFLVPADQQRYDDFRRRLAAHLPVTLPDTLPARFASAARDQNFARTLARWGENAWGVLYFSPGWTPHLSPYKATTGEILLGTSFQQRLRPFFNHALRPVFDAAGVTWRPAIGGLAILFWAIMAFIVLVWILAATTHPST